MKSDLCSNRLHEAVSTYLRALSLPVKIFLLLALGAILFGSNLLVSAQHLDIYFACLVSSVALLLVSGYWVLSKRVLKNMLFLWAIGVVIYLVFASIKVYSGGALSPYFTLTNVYDRWFYVWLFPVILLGTFTVGLIFMAITSPAEFLRWGDTGLKIALLFRAFEQAIQVLQDTKTALLMRGEWIEEGDEIISLRKTWRIIKYSPLLIRVSVRNIILFWFPWGWLCAINLQKLMQRKK